MSEQVEQMVLEYLSKVGDAAYGHLSPRRRAAYLAEVRSRIEAACAAAKADTPEGVRRVLREFGDPRRFVSRELGIRATTATGVAAVDTLASDTPSTGQEPGAQRPVREPPPWRGGPERGWFGRSAGSTAALRGRVRSLIRDSVLRSPAAARRQPVEALAIMVYIISGSAGPAAFLWIVGAVLVGLSGLWSTVDKRVALLVPIAATLAGMAFWQGETAYLDQAIRNSLAETGVLGLRVAAIGCALYLAVRLTRVVRTRGDGDPRLPH